MAIFKKQSRAPPTNRGRAKIVQGETIDCWIQQAALWRLAVYVADGRWLGR
jgi:hypothetical protein